MFRFDKKYFSKYNIIAGIDEAGRGPLAGPVVAASVIFSQNTYIEGVNDSKKISKKKRELFYDKIQSNALHIGVGVIYPEKIDKINILNATKEAMNLSIIDLGIIPDLILVDGNQIEFEEYNQISIVKGDSKSASIASASIIAKVTRDRIMDNYDKILPEYGFCNNKGYGTKAHFAAVIKYKSSIIHRKSFKPVNNHLPSFSYYIDNEILDRLLVQIAGDYLIRLNHDIIDVQGLCISSTSDDTEYFSYIHSNINTESNKIFDHNDNYKTQVIIIDFKNGKHEIIVNPI